ncbi:nucleotidyltransferase domain-containing protein [Longimicrobium sp.]|uniref:nucleotidyltransferase domain-containing protein n=1 Tax=Longimicrobium sp. TaxID=2029185 RepID=UPI002ED98273
MSAAVYQTRPSSRHHASYAVRTPKRSDALSSTLASGAMARVVIDFAVHPDDASHGREIQRRTGLTPRSLNAELARLELLGVIRRRPEGRLVRYGLVESNPRWKALRELVAHMADPADVLRNALADVAGVGAAFIFGSIARGNAREGSDIDVFVLDEGVDEDRLARRTLDVGVLLGREVNVVQMTPGQLADRIASGSSFIREVLRGKKQWVVGSEADLSPRLNHAETI